MASNESAWGPIEWTDEELYRDSSTGEPFTAESKRIVDEIAYHPRFGLRFGDEKLIFEGTAGLEPDRARIVEEAARRVHEHRVRPAIKLRAEDEIGRILEDPRFELLPEWGSEPPNGAYFARYATEIDERLFQEVMRSIASDRRFVAARQRARRKVEADAAALAIQLPQRIRDLLFFSNRISERETAVAGFISTTSPLRLQWMAYEVQRHVRERDEQSTMDRYSIAAKHFVGYGQRKAEVRHALGVSMNRLDHLLRRSTSGTLDGTDPLVVAFPILRAAARVPEVNMDATVIEQRLPVSRMYVSDLVDLVEYATDPDLLRRILKRKSVHVAEALLKRHVAVGDVDDAVLVQIPTDFPGLHALLDAHRKRPLPPRTALAVASAEPVAVLDFSDETLTIFESGSDARLEVVLALRKGDVEELIGILNRAENDPLFLLLVEMLVARPMREALRAEPAFSDAIVAKAERLESAGSAATLLLAACQNEAAMSRTLERARMTGDLGFDPSALVQAALGGHHRRGDGNPAHLLISAQRLWSVTDHTVEHGLARAVVERAGEVNAVIATPLVTYVASADAIRAYSNAEERQYTYVHLHLSAARERRFGDLVVRTPTRIPALPYVRERGKHPDAPHGPDVDIIVWPLPFRPAIYSLDTGLSEVAGYFAVAGTKIAVLDELVGFGK